ncbi:methyltransferase domain-containing protein [Methylobacterium sp. OAE515]|uniref:methyltransferase domain-containing protein n=1 Tax=Methylobacterium sp. OAE515 TaxID=2817895 RepID=UPI0017897403
MARILNCSSDVIHQRASEMIEQVGVVLDIGCGVRSQQFVLPKFLICVEPFHEYRGILKRNFKDCDCVIIPTDALTALEAMPNQSVDTVFLLDVIEHITRDEGLRVISECERVARAQIVVYTPLGYMPQEIKDGEKDAWNLNGGSFQQHKSGWTPEDFPEYDILVCEDLHKSDFKGQAMDDAFGGFYAIRRQPTSIFNSTADCSTYGNIMRPAVYGLKEVVKEVARINSRRALLEAAIKSCQYTTERLISSTDGLPLETLYTEVETWRDQKRAELKNIIDAHYSTVEQDRSESATDLINYDALEAALRERESRLTEREAQLSGHERNLSSWEKDIRKREAWIAEKNIQFSGHESNLKNWENDVRRREAWIAEKDIQFSGHESNLKNWENDVRRREAWIVEKEAQLAGHENNLSNWETDIRRREDILSQTYSRKE